jgi:hypothetical protein
MNTRIPGSFSALAIAVVLGCAFDRDLPGSADTDGTDGTDGTNGTAGVDGGATDPTSTDGEPLDVSNVAERLAAAECRSYVACGECSDRSNDLGMAECMDQLRPGHEQQIATAQDHGLVFDAQCAAQAIAFFDAGSCEAETAARRDALDALAACEMFVGTLAPGESCEPLATGFPYVPDLDPCAPGSRCISDVCVAIAAVAEACDNTDARGENVCVDGAYCRQSIQCEPRGAIGEPCDRAYIRGSCANDAYCTLEEVCAPRTPLGSPCQFDTQSIPCDGTCSDDNTSICVESPSACTLSFNL